MCEDFASIFGDKRTGCCTTTTHRLTLPFSSGNFRPKTTRLSSLIQPTFPCFSRLKIKLKGRHFDTIEAMEAESQAVVNTLTEYGFSRLSAKLVPALEVRGCRVFSAMDPHGRIIGFNITNKIKIIAFMSNKHNNNSVRVEDIITI
jgi:hypothetical protein